MGRHNQTFDDFEQWVRHASSWLTQHRQYCNTEHGEETGWRGHHFTAICFDTQGRLCRQGSDFMRARDEHTFPVMWLWPNQIPFLVHPDDGAIEEVVEEQHVSQAHGRRFTHADALTIITKHAIEKGFNDEEE